MKPASDRLFLGVALPRPARQRLDDGIGEALGAAPEARRIPPDNWHLTLRFLGATTPRQRTSLERSLESATLPGRFEILITGWGAFPRPAAARVLWLGVRDPAGGLSALHDVAEAAARAAGFEGEDRPYSPHLTIARLRDPHDLRALLPSLPPITIDIVVDRLILFRSILGSGPPIYEPLRELPLES